MVLMGLRRPRELMNTQSEMRSTGYRIGAVAKLTGISPDALRVWERRYAVVKTGGTSSGGRLYSDDDIARDGVPGDLLFKRQPGVGTGRRDALPICSCATGILFKMESSKDKFSSGVSLGVAMPVYN